MTVEVATELASTLLQTLSIAITSFFAVLGLSAWRQQIVGKRRMEVAEEVLAAFYRFRDTLSWIRCPIGFSNEAAGRDRLRNESEMVAVIKDGYFVPFARLERVEEMLDELSRLVYIARVYFGSDVEEPFNEVRSALSEVVVSARMLMEIADAEIEETLRKDWEAAIWSANSNTEPDGLAQRVNRAVISIERICRPSVTSAQNTALL